MLSDKINSFYLATLNWHDEMVEYEKEHTFKEADFWTYDQEVYENPNDQNLPIIHSPEKNRLALVKLVTSPKGRNYLVSELARKKQMLNHLKGISKEVNGLIKGIQTELKTAE